LSDVEYLPSEELEADKQKLTNQVNELTIKLDIRDRELQELTNEIVNLKNKLLELDNSVVNNLQNIDDDLETDKEPLTTDNEQLTTDNEQLTTPEETDSDLTSDTQSPIINDQSPLWDNKIMKNPVDSIRKQLKKKNITKSAEEIKQSFLNAGFDGSNHQSLREEVIKNLSQE
jgi:chromosome segregation ATPase